MNNERIFMKSKKLSKENMQSFKKNLLVTFVLASCATASQAQWAVTNINDVIYFSPTGVFTQVIGRLIGAAKGSVDQVAALQQMEMKQQPLLIQDADRRNRMAIGQADIAKRDFEAMPTIRQCVEMTQRGVYSAPTIVNYGSSYSGGGANMAGQAVRARTITTTGAAQNAILQSKPAIGTCSGPDDMSPGCSGAPPGQFAGADVKPKSLFANMDANGRINGMEIKNFSLDAKGVDAATKYINDATLFDAPKYLSPAQAAKNPSYAAMYQAMMSKLNAAQDAMFDVMKMRVGAPLAANSMAAKLWNDSKPIYNSLFPGLVHPTNPSLYELLNYNVYKDYMGQLAETDKMEDLIRENNKRVALSNFIAWRQTALLEKNNILLGHMLAQMTTPVKKEVVDNEHNKTSQLR